MNRRARGLLWFDGSAGLSAGCLMLALHDWLARLHGFPHALVLLMGVTNLLYASYSGTLAVRATRGTPPSRRAIDLLIAGNLTWTCVCAGLLVARLGSASMWGFLQLGFEGLFVATLALLEYRFVRPFTR